MSRIRLGEEYIKLLESLPEQGMGYQVVDIKLVNGLVLKERVVLNCEFLKLHNNESLNPHDIIEVSLSQK